MLGHSPKIITDGVVFYYDMANAQKSWKGRPSRNYVAYTPNYVNWNSQDAVVSQISTEIQRISSASNVAIDAIWWGGFNTGTADSATKISYSAYVRGQGTSYLQIHQVNTSPNTVAHMGISGNTITLDSSQWKRIEIKDIYQASGTASQNILVGLGAGVGNYVEVKNVQCEYQTFPSAYINPSLYTNGIRSNDQAIIDLVGSNTITANSLTYNSDGSFNFTAANSSNILLADSVNTRFTHNSPWTIQLIFKVTAFVGSFPGIFIKGSASSSGVIVFYENTGNLLFKHNNTQSVISSYTLGQYMMLTITFDGSTVKAYKNGTYTTNGVSMVSTDTTNSLQIGRADQYGDQFIDSVLKYNRALSAAEVYQNFNALRGRYGI